jgi:hypothetical protein
VRLIAITAVGLLAACSGSYPVAVSQRGTSAHTSHSSPAKRRPSYATYDAGVPPPPPLDTENGDTQRRQEAYADSQAQIAQQRIDQAQVSLAKAQEKKAEADARLRLIRENPKLPDYTQY